MSLVNRFFSVTSSRIRHKIEEFITSKKSEDNKESQSKNNHQQDDSDYQSPLKKKTQPEFIVDLELFDLHPLSTWEEVRRRRNVLMKQYHSDLHSQDSQKEKTAKEITQIYNEAYERLKKHFGKT